jgi:hypothetical protein
LKCEKIFEARQVLSGFEMAGAPALAAFARVGGFSIFSGVRISMSRIAPYARNIIAHGCPPHENPA